MSFIILEKSQKKYKYVAQSNIMRSVKKSKNMFVNEE
jgi:hypothetical protein